VAVQRNILDSPEKENHRAKTVHPRLPGQERFAGALHHGVDDDALRAREQQYQPPAMDGTNKTRSPSFSGEDSPLRKRMSSSLR
jgi:hypothetical protein